MQKKIVLLVGGYLHWNNTKYNYCEKSEFGFSIAHLIRPGRTQLPGSWVPHSPGAGSPAKELIFATYVEIHVELGCEFRTWDHPSNLGSPL